MKDKNKAAETNKKNTDGEILSDEIETIYGNVQEVRRIAIAPHDKLIFPWKEKVWEVAAKDVALQKMLAEIALIEDGDIAGLIYHPHKNEFDYDSLLGRWGYAVHVRKTERTAGGLLLAYVAGLCRFTVTGDIDFSKGYPTAEIEWFDDEEEMNPASRDEAALVIELATMTQNVVRIAKACGDELKQFQTAPKIPTPHVAGKIAHQMSFMQLDTLNYFTDEQKLEMMLVRSTLERLRYCNKHMQKVVFLLENKIPIRSRARNN